MRKSLLVILGLFFLLSQVFAQDRILSGKITDEAGNPVPGASVQAKGTTLATSADNNGNFKLSVPASVKSLIISSVNFETLEVSIGRSNELAIQLKSKSGDLSELVLIAYGTQSSRRVTGSQTKIGGDAIKNIPLPSIDQMLQGKAAGLQALATSGQPGAATQLRIRGIGSISASSEPLFVIDGVPVLTGDGSSLSNSSNLLASLNPDDIESITVLKDASATSIYGSRGSNGVILINTKKGKSGKAKITVDGEFGSNNIAFFPSVSTPLTRDQFGQLTTEGIINAGGTQSDVNTILGQYGYNSNANYNWLDLVRRKGQQNQINVSASGGTNTSTYYLSGGYFYQQSPVIGSDLKRYSVDLSGSLKTNEKLTIGSTLNLSTFHQRSPNEGSSFRNPIIDALSLRPSQEAYKTDGTPEYDRTIFEQLYNPLAINQYDRLNNNTSKLLGNINLEYKILPSLVFQSKYGVDFNNIVEDSYRNPFFGDARTTQGSFTTYSRNLFNYIFTNTLTYSSRFFDDKADVNFLAGHEAQKTKDNRIGGGGTGVPLTTAITYPSVTTPTVTAVWVPTSNDIESYFSRALLNYSNKYNLSATVRRDGSSRFGPNDRWGIFWSVGAGWNIDREDFIKNISFISSLKLRGSYGTSGNNRGIGDFDWRATYAFNGSYNGQPASGPNTVGNPDLTWEKNKSYDAGLEIGILKDRVHLDIDYYNRKTYDLLLLDPLSGTSGFINNNRNVGSMVNKGFEITLDAIPVQTKNFSWDINFNGAWNKNRILALTSVGGDIIAAPIIRRVGQDFQSIYTRIWAGVDPASGNPLWYTDGTKTATTSDVTKVQRAIVGTASPKGFGSLTNTLQYKGFSLSAQFNYQYGNMLYDQWGFIYFSDGALPNLNKNQRELERWKKPGDITQVPKYVFNNSNSSNALSTRYFYKGDFVRLRTLTVGYSLPTSISQKLKLSTFSFYVRGTNIWTWVKDKNLAFDPEQPVTGIANNQFFIPKTFTAGFSLTF